MFHDQAPSSAIALHSKIPNEVRCGNGELSVPHRAKPPTGLFAEIYFDVIVRQME
ncbi:hypothetical protein [Calothrix sp. PCC 7507]|uniref:hypothetical protein n=1 Tax=Calothrix sp. PCC 7507 TaxID=99598 RepID=UPI00029F238A|nr:hypothetical protein [Calothrix sp. PCC 7507]AFY30541.1 hypothetical protein Cal7507_0027 [Calothrix sp. PCC 7507]